jgi:hypothetical protein
VTRSIHRFAADDLEQAAMFYKREAGVGIARGSFPLVNFPYSIIYRTEERGIRILVVHHHSRDPSYGDSRQ